MGRANLSKSGIASLEPGIPVPFSQGITSGAVIQAHFFCSNVLRGPKSVNNLHRVWTIYGIYKNNFVKKQILRQNLKLEVPGHSGKKRRIPRKNTALIPE
jgi:hypothetical protein